MNRLNKFFIFSAVLTALFWGFKSSAQAGYDLKAESLTQTSASCEVNQPCVFTARVKNSGDEFVLSFQLKNSASAADYKTDSPTVLSTPLGATVKTNDYLIFTVRGIFTAVGAKILTFSVNPAGFLIETNTGNNSVDLTVNVAGYDLIAETLTVSPPNPAVGQTCYIQAKIKNGSSYNLYSGAGLDIIRSLPDFSLTASSSTSPTLASVVPANGYLYFGFTGKFTAPGEKNLTFTIDPEDALNESITTNNSLSQKITINNADQTDLSLNSVVFSAEKIILGVPFDLTLGVKNSGKNSLTAPGGLQKSNLSYNLPNFEFGLNDFTADSYPSLSTPLNPNGTFYYKFHGAFNQPGSFNLAFEVNKDRSLPEASYANNSTTTPVVVYKTQADADSFSLLSKSVNFISSTTAAISWKTSLKTTAIFSYNFAGGSLADNRSNITESALEHTKTLNNLIPGAKYQYSIVISNGTAEKVEMPAEFTTPANDVLTAAAAPMVSLSGQNASFSWTTNLKANDRVYYRKKGAANLISSGNDIFTVAHKIDLINLDYGQYEFFVSSTSTPGVNYKTGWAGFEIVKAPAALAQVPATGGSQIAAVSTGSLAVANDALYNNLKGKIILKVESLGEAYYVSQKEKKLFYLGKPEDAFAVIRAQGAGIINADLNKIPVGLSGLSGEDADGDGLPDAVETALGTDKNKADTDGDGYNDKAELLNGYSPLARGAKMNYDSAFAAKQKGKIFLQVQSRGQAWYVNPADGKRYFLARPTDAHSLMRQLGTGISNANFSSLAR